MTDTATVDVGAQALISELMALRSEVAELRTGRSTSVHVRSEPLTYYHDGSHSYVQDLVLTELGREAPKGAHERLRRHGAEMRVLQGEVIERGLRAARALSVEYRTEPNTTQGQGGYFTPPLWANQLFATANRPHRVLARLIGANFPLPPGCVSVNVPIISTGSTVQPQVSNQAVSDTDITDTSGFSPVVMFAGEVDCALQMLEQSPPSAHLDWAFFMDMSEAYDSDLEQQIIYGSGSSSITSQLPGLANVANVIAITYTSGSPTQQGLWPTLGKAFAQVGDARDLQPECYLMRSARWAWILSATGTDNVPFGILSPMFLGADPDTPDPIGGLYGLPVFLDDAIPATVTAGTPYNWVSGTQDVVLCVRPSDMVFLESAPQMNIYREPLSGSLGVRLQMHGSAAAVMSRRPSGIGVIGGTGLAVQSGF